MYNVLESHAHACSDDNIFIRPAITTIDCTCFLHARISISPGEVWASRNHSSIITNNMRAKIRKYIILLIVVVGAKQVATLLTSVVRKTRRPWTQEATASKRSSSVSSQFFPPPWNTFFLLNTLLDYTLKLETYWKNIYILFHMRIRSLRRGNYIVWRADQTGVCMFYIIIIIIIDSAYALFPLVRSSSCSIKTFVMSTESTCWMSFRHFFIKMINWLIDLLSIYTQAQKLSLIKNMRRKLSLERIIDDDVGTGWKK